MTGTNWQDFAAATPELADTLLIRDVSDNLSVAAGKVKQVRVADLLALLASPGGGGGGGAGEFAAVGGFIETTDVSFAWTPAAAGNILVVIADSTESGNAVTAAASETATWARVVSGVKAGSVTQTAETAFVGTAAGLTEETVTLTTAAAPGNLRVLAHEFSTGGVPVSLAVFVTMDGDSDGDSVTAWPAIAGTGLMFGYERNFGDGDGAAVAGSTAGVTYHVDANTNGGAYAIIDGSVTVGWGDTDSRTVLVLLLALGPGGGTGGGGGSGGEDLTVIPVADDQVSSSSGVAHSVTSFSPPAGSMVRVTATWLDATDQLGKTFTCKDSLNNSYTATLAGGDSDGGCYLLIFDHQYATAPGAITVTITAAGTGATAAADCLIQPYVITGQASDQSTAAHNSVSGNVSISTCEISVTTTEAGGIVFVAGAPNNTGHPVPSPIAGTVTDAEWDDDDVGSHGVIGRTSSPTAAPGTKTYGWTLSAASVFGFGAIAAEVLPVSSGGGGGSGGSGAVPQAPLLGTYPGDGFPTPGPSAWPSGAQTNIAAQYFAWDDTASSVASFIGKCKSNGLIPFVELEPWHYDQSAVLFSSITSGGSDTFLEGIGSAIASAGIPVILTFAHEMNVSGQYPWSQGMSGSGPGGGNLSSTNWKLGWNYVRTKVNSTANGLALWLWGSSAWTGGTTIDPSPWWPSPVPDMVGIDGYPDTKYGASLGTFNGQIKPTVTAIRSLGWTGDIFIAETNLREMVDSGGESITNFVRDMAANGVSGVLEFEDPAWGLSPMTSAQWTEYHNAVAANY